MQDKKKYTNRKVSETIILPFIIFIIFYFLFLYFFFIFYYILSCKKLHAKLDDAKDIFLLLGLKWEGIGRSSVRMRTECFPLNSGKSIKWCLRHPRAFKNREQSPLLPCRPTSARREHDCPTFLVFSSLDFLARRQSNIPDGHRPFRIPPLQSTRAPLQSTRHDAVPPEIVNGTILLSLLPGQKSK